MTTADRRFMKTGAAGAALLIAFFLGGLRHSSLPSTRRVSLALPATLVKGRDYRVVLPKASGSRVVFPGDDLTVRLDGRSLTVSGNEIGSTRVTVLTAKRSVLTSSATWSGRVAAQP